MPAGQIVTFTANPCIDRTLVLPGPVVPGQLHRATAVRDQASGKGLNVARITAAAGLGSAAVLTVTSPAYLDLLDADRPPLLTVTAPPQHGLHPRLNLTVVDPAGVTTKLNEPGPLLTDEDRTAAAAHLAAAADGAAWVVLSGSLPRGVPAGWYVDLARTLRPLGARLAVDTSDAPLAAVVGALDDIGVEVLKPNLDEMAQIAGLSPTALEADAAAGRFTDVVRAGRDLVGRGAVRVLATLGSAGALLVQADGAWLAPAPSVSVRNTVGAGDAALAGLLVADAAGSPPPDALRLAVAYGTAAAAWPETGLPDPTRITSAGVTVRSLD